MATWMEKSNFCAFDVAKTHWDLRCLHYKLTNLRTMTDVSFSLCEQQIFVLKGWQNLLKKIYLSSIVLSTQKNETNTGRTIMLHTKRSLPHRRTEPRAPLLWGDRANHCTNYGNRNIWSLRVFPETHRCRATNCLSSKPGCVKLKVNLHWMC